MRYIATVFLLVSLLSSQNKVTAQQFALDEFYEVVSKGVEKPKYTVAKQNKNEFEAIFSGLFLTYKSFFSSQDQTVCTFTPSCSEYGLIAVKKFGTVKGGIMTLDRMMRCNGLSPQNYEYDKAQGLLKDDPRVPYPQPLSVR